MMAPQNVPVGCPPGLQYLTMVDQLLVKQKVEILEAVTGDIQLIYLKEINSLLQWPCWVTNNISLKAERATGLEFILVVF